MNTDVTDNSLCSPDVLTKVTNRQSDRNQLMLEKQASCGTSLSRLRFRLYFCNLVQIRAFRVIRGGNELDIDKAF